MKITTPKWAYDKEINFKSPKRKVDTVFVHCSASDSASHDDISVIKHWHMVDNKWSRVGYHFFINNNGDIQEGCPLEKAPIAQKNHNTGSIAICLHGLKKTKFTDAQLSSVKKLCSAINDSYENKIRIRGHKEVSKKACPVFDYKATLGLNDQGYYKGDESVSSETGTANDPGSKKKPLTPENIVTNVIVSKTITPIRLLSNGPKVRTLQILLCDLGFICIVDSAFGQNTALKIKTFQRRYELSADGIVGAKTIDRMFSSKDLIIKRTDRGIDVKVLQLMLAMFGNHIVQDGIFGLGTERVLKNQQSLFGLKKDGIFGPNSRSKILNN